MATIRVSAKAIIIRNGRLLATKNVDDKGVFYVLPGGGQQPGEPLPVALRRECKEEIGVEVKVGDLVLVRDYIGSNHEFAQWDGDVHQVELMLLCSLPGNSGYRRYAGVEGTKLSIRRRRRQGRRDGRRYMRGPNWPHLLRYL